MHPSVYMSQYIWPLHVTIYLASLLVSGHTITLTSNPILIHHLMHIVLLIGNFAKIGICELFSFIDY